MGEDCLELSRILGRTRCDDPVTFVMKVSHWCLEQIDCGMGRKRNIIFALLLLFFLASSPFPHPCKCHPKSESFANSSREPLLVPKQRRHLVSCPTRAHSLFQTSFSSTLLVVVLVGEYAGSEGRTVRIIEGRCKEIDSGS